MMTAFAAAQTPPLPRPKPQKTTTRAPDPALANAVSTGRGGRIEIAVPGLGRERDPFQSAELQPSVGKNWPADQVRKARQRCELVLAATNVDAVQLDPIGGPGGCGIAAPVKVLSLGAVRMKPAATLNCTMAGALYKWVTDGVQPAALDAYDEPVMELRNVSSYSCRRRNNLSKGRISEHAFGNALDVAYFTLASGKEVTVLKQWNTGWSAALGFNKDGQFLSDAHKSACKTFSTVLGPENDKAHDDHFHLDLGRGGRYKICK